MAAKNIDEISSPQTEGHRHENRLPWRTKEGNQARRLLRRKNFVA